MIDRSDLDVLTGTTAYDIDGKKIGAVGQVYLDATTGEPAWLAVRTGLFGTGESFVPVADAALEGDGVRVGHSKDVVKDAPRVDADAELAQQDVDALYSYYRLDTPTDREADQSTPSTGHDARDLDADDSMTRSEQQLRAETEKVETGRARLRKYVVTEQETITVPVSHQEVRLVSEPITETEAHSEQERQDDDKSQQPR